MCPVTPDTSKSNDLGTRLLVKGSKSEMNLKISHYTIFIFNIFIAAIVVWVALLTHQKKGFEILK